MRPLSIKVIIFLLIFGLIGSWYGLDLANQHFHEDEYVWVYRGGRHFEALFLNHDLSPQIWDHYYSYDQPKLAEFLYGGWLWIWYRQPPSLTFKETGFQPGGIEEMGERLEDAWWVVYQASPPQLEVIPEQWRSAYGVVVHARWPSVVFGLSTLFALFLVGQRLGNMGVGVLALLLLAQHPLFFRESHHAMADSILLFFLTSGLAWALWWPGLFRRLSFWPLTGAIGGLLAGLAGSVKLNGFLAMVLGLVTLLAVGVQVALQGKRKLRKTLAFTLVSGLILGAVSLGVFVALNPYTWPDPPGRLREMISWRSQEAQKLQVNYQGGSFTTFTQGLRGLAEETVLPQDGDQRLLSWLPSQVDLALASLGLVLLFFEGFIRQRNQSVLIFWLWFLGTLTAMGLYLTVDFDRYFLPIVPFWALIEAYGVGMLGFYVYKAGRLLRS